MRKVKYVLDKQMNMRLQASEKRLIAKAAKLDKVSPSTYARESVIACAKVRVELEQYAKSGDLKDFARTFNAI